MTLISPTNFYKASLMALLRDVSALERDAREEFRSTLQALYHGSTDTFHS